MNAKEARRKAETNLKTSNNITQVFQQIERAVSKGEFKVRIYDLYLSNGEIGYLQSLGYGVKSFSEDRPCSSFCIEISW